MNNTLHTINTAPSASVPALEGVLKSLGFIPNLFATFANAPAVLEGYLGISTAFAKSSFTASEQQIILLTASAENGCSYCVAAHTTIGKMQKIDKDILGALRDSQPLTDKRLETLRVFTSEVVKNRGMVSESTQTSFIKAGYTSAQALEVILGVAMKTLSNYVNHLSSPPLDSAFSANAWSPKDREPESNTECCQK